MSAAPLRPWETGYVAGEAKIQNKAEIGRLGGLTKAARKAAGLPPKPKAGDGTGKQGAKRTNVEVQEKYDAMTEETIPLKKKEFLDRFIYEYLHDFNSSMAYIRAGGTVGRATTGGPESLRTAYVQTQLRLVSHQLEEEQIVTRNEVLLGIKREANYYGEDGSSSARVRAWGMLAKIKGMDVPKPIEPEDNKPAGGVMEVPMIVSAADWELVASESQATLKNDVRK